MCQFKQANSMSEMMTHALKEWAIAVEALERGETIVLLRKGGIRERGGKFTIDRDRVLLYPTYEHQKPELLKPEYARKVTPVESGWHPETVRIGSWAQITDILPASDRAAVSALLPYHIWTDRLTEDRLKWKPQQPLYVLLLRVFRLAQVRQIPYREAYGGCRSWIELTDAIAIADSSPVLTEAEYRSRSQAVRDRLAEAVTPSP
jgi:hypothetical protein